MARETHRGGAWARSAAAVAGDLPFLPDQGADCRARRARTGRSRPAQSRPHLWPRHRGGHRLRRVAARRGRRRGPVDRRTPVAAAGRADGSGCRARPPAARARGAAHRGATNRGCPGGGLHERRQESAGRARPPGAAARYRGGLRHRRLPRRGAAGLAAGTVRRMNRIASDAPAPAIALAPYAAHDAQSRGRRYAEPPPQFRREFQRDRDRIIHCNAFRRLAYKTQVFVNHECDLYRTRVTHSLEVAQIARSIALALRLNEALVEAISLAHDLGHTPFGHAGQDALNECMREYGGFEHNLQSLRVVDELEERYPDFQGLNLTFECREGILKHCALPKARELGDVGQRFIDRTRSSLEAQLANLEDEIAYNNHDVDDGLRAGLITLDDLCEVGLVRRHTETVRAAHPQLPARRAVHEIIRRMINEVVVDVIRTSEALLRTARPSIFHAVRNHDAGLIAMSEDISAQHLELKRFLRERVYRHHRVLRMTSKAKRVLESLFAAFMSDARLMPEEYCTAALRAEAADGPRGRPPTVADHVAAMTDRYAILEHRRLFDPAERT